MLQKSGNGQRGTRPRPARGAGDGSQERARPASRRCASQPGRVRSYAGPRHHLHVERDRGEHALRRGDDARRREGDHDRRKAAQGSSRGDRSLRSPRLCQDARGGGAALARGRRAQPASARDAAVGTRHRRAICRQGPLRPDRDGPARLPVAGRGAGAHGLLLGPARLLARRARGSLRSPSASGRHPPVQRRQRPRGPALDEPDPASGRLSPGRRAAGRQGGLHGGPAGGPSWRRSGCVRPPALYERLADTLDDYIGAARDALA